MADPRRPRASDPLDPLIERRTQVPSLLDIDATPFADVFARRSIAVRHVLAEHPLFAMDAIAELSDRLPPGSVPRERGDLPIVNRHRYVDVGRGPPSSSIRAEDR